MSKDRPVVLVVDDSVDTRDLYVEILDHAGFMTLAAGSVAEARGMLGQVRVAVIVADYSLPDGTGAELTKLCADVQPKVCILVTGHAAANVDVTGFQVTLRKPIKGDDLLAAIRAHV